MLFVRVVAFVSTATQREITVSLVVEYFVLLLTISNIISISISISISIIITCVAVVVLCDTNGN